MIGFVKKLFIVAGIVTILSPTVMLFVWNRYVTEQETLYGAMAADYKECDPYDLLITYDQQEKMVFQWKTKQDCQGLLLLGKNYSDFSLEPYTVLPAQNTEKTKLHTISLIKQDELSFTYAVIVSDGVWFGIHGAPFAYKQITAAGTN